MVVCVLDLGTAFGVPTLANFSPHLLPRSGPRLYNLAHQGHTSRQPREEGTYETAELDCFNYLE